MAQEWDISQNLEGEVWRCIDETQPKKYYISNMGRVRSEKQIIKLFKNIATGVWQGMIRQDGKAKLLNVSTWVARLFLEPPTDSERMIVRHKTQNLADNRACNLVWAYRRDCDNIKAGIVTGAIKRKNNKRKNVYIVRQVTPTGVVLGTFVGFDLLKRMGFNRTSIAAAAKGHSYRGSIYKGYMWEVEKHKQEIIDVEDND